MSSPRRTLLLAASALTIPVALLLAACGGGGSRSVKATETDFAIKLDNASVQAGRVRFSVTNDGPSQHEFVVLKTDLPAAGLPVSNDQAEEEAEGVEHVDEVEELGSGQTGTLDVKLDPGNYVLICNIPGHYEQGMRAAFTVN